MCFRRSVERRAATDGDMEPHLRQMLVNEDEVAIALVVKDEDVESWFVSRTVTGPCRRAGRES